MDPNSLNDDDLLALLEEFANQGGLPGAFTDYEGKQNILDQQMALAQQMREPGPRHGTPMGALFGGLSDAIGNVAGAVGQNQGLKGQADLVNAKEKDATGRYQTWIDMLRKKQPAGSAGLLPTMSDADLAVLMGG